MIISTIKLSKEFTFYLKKINPNLEFKLCKSKKSVIFSNYVIKKLQDFNSISVLQSSFLNFNDNFLNDKIMKNPNIISKYSLGITNIVNNLNKNNKLLTDRDKNSSVTFFDDFKFPKLLKIIRNKQFEKIVVKLSDLKKIKKFIFSINSIKNNNVKYYVYSNNNKLNLESKNIDDKNSNGFYVVVENYE